MSEHVRGFFRIGKVVRGPVVFRDPGSSLSSRCTGPSGLVHFFMRSGRVHVGAAVLVCGVVLGCAGGCSRPILTDTEARSQFARFERVREDAEPAYFVDEFGRSTPNLRGRLLESR